MEKKILVLENEKEIARLYAKCLKAEGYDPELAFDGLEGLEKLKDIKPDLILLDLAMPKMSGLEFYEHICSSHEKCKYPVLVLTGRADLETVFKDFPVDGFIIKPFGGTRLLKEVNIIINNHYSKNTDDGIKKIIIVDDERESAENIRCVLSRAGYKAEIAASGTAGIEKIMVDPPDLAMVNLGLTDLAGDLVIMRMQQMVKTRGTSALLYVKKNFKHDKIILEQFARKRGVKLMLEYGESAELLNAAVEVFQGPEEEN
jgi:two-component system chemotaxis response regulator CheY